MSEEENRRLYGKCNNPFGHGHNYVVDVTAAGPADCNGLAVPISILDELVAREVLGPFDHRNLNTEAAAFAREVPTSENLAREICRRLKRNWEAAFGARGPKLLKVRIEETARNIFEIRADEIE